MTQRVAITGSSGLIGGALSSFLRQRGDDVVHLVRRPPAAAHETQWDPSTRHLPASALDGVDAVVNLAGAGVGDHRWTPSYKREILTSRVDATHAVATAIADVATASGRHVRLVNGSAIGAYGDRGHEELTEESALGTGFLSEVVRAWEGATAPATDAGAPVAFARTGIVMGRGGGAMRPLLRLARLGLAGPLGSGRQYWPWITLHDDVRALAHLLDQPGVTGPVNLVGPDPRPQREIVAELARQLHRPAVVPAPTPALRLVLGEFADDILSSDRVLPAVLIRTGFVHDHATLPDAVGWLLSG